MLANALSQITEADIVEDRAKVWIEASVNVDPIYPDRVEDLFARDSKFWSGINVGFRCDARRYDSFLKKIRFSRQTNLAIEQRSQIRKFLGIGYIRTKDVRYFNEFLWFSSAEVISAGHELVVEFKKNLNYGCFHTFPLADREVVRNFVSCFQTETTSRKVGESFRVGLLGSPCEFSGLARKLKRLGCGAKIYDIPYSPRPLIHFLKNRPFLAKLNFLLKGCTQSYQTLSLDESPFEVDRKLRKEQLDLGIHNLGFIIKKHFIEPFRLGIVNDHLGVLPFIRGRSTLEYSILYGFPLTATVHFIDEGIDTGKIVKIFDYTAAALSLGSLQSVRNFILQDRVARFLQVVLDLSANENLGVENIKDAGFQYFEMHPALLEYVEKICLKQFQSSKS
jgi:hypothetical protein